MRDFMVAYGGPLVPLKKKKLIRYNELAIRYNELAIRYNELTPPSLIRYNELAIRYNELT